MEGRAMQKESSELAATTESVSEPLLSLGDATTLTLGGSRRGSEDKRYVYSTMDPVEQGGAGPDLEP
jgi:hypothetical protein